MNDKAVLVLDDDDDLRAIVCDLLAAKGATCFGVGSLDEVIALGTRALSCDLAILDVNLGPAQPSGVDAYHWMKAQSFSGRTVFLTGHARTHPSVAKANDLGVKVLEKPVSLLDLVKLMSVEHSR
jgi:DNA-binding NtrC family response regulator